MCVVNELLFATSILGNMDQGEKEWRYLHAKRVKHTPPFNAVLQKPLTKYARPRGNTFLYRYNVNSMFRNCFHSLVVDEFSLWNNIKENIPFHWFYFRVPVLWLRPPDSMYNWDFLSRSPRLIDIRRIDWDIPSGSQFLSLKSNKKGDKAVTTY